MATCALVWFKRASVRSAWCGQHGVTWRQHPQTRVMRARRNRDGWARRWQARMSASPSSLRRVFRGAPALPLHDLPRLATLRMQSGTTGINTFRICSPTRQAHDQDPDGHFIRRWVPELACAEWHTRWPAPTAYKRWMIRMLAISCANCTTASGCSRSPGCSPRCRAHAAASASGGIARSCSAWTDQPGLINPR